MRIPADEEIRRLHEKHAPTTGALDLVYTHCDIVCAIVEQLGGQPGERPDGQPGERLGGPTGPAIDIGLARAGALLHDIGVYRLYDGTGRLDHGGYLRHGILGHELLRDEGFPEPICRFASCHTGVGISREDVIRQELPLPPGDYLAETGEEALVMYADKFHSKTTPPAFLTAAAYAAMVRRFGEDKVAAFRQLRDRFGEPDLAALSEAYGHRIRNLPATRPVHATAPCIQAPCTQQRMRWHRRCRRIVHVTAPALSPGRMRWRIYVRDPTTPMAPSLSLRAAGRGPPLDAG